MRKLSWEGMLFIIQEEWLVLEAYLDQAGVWTIGVGHTARSGGLKPRAGMKITVQQGLDLFKKDLAKFERGVSLAIEDTIEDELTQAQFDALVSFHFNTGAIKTGTVDDLINRGDLKRAVGKLSQYTKVKGKTSAGLKNRRAREAALFQRGNYGDISKVPVCERYPGKVRMVPVDKAFTTAEQLKARGSQIVELGSQVKTAGKVATVAGSGLAGLTAAAEPDKPASVSSQLSDGATAALDKAETALSFGERVSYVMDAIGLSIQSVFAWAISHWYFAAVPVVGWVAWHYGSKIIQRRVDDENAWRHAGEHTLEDEIPDEPDDEDE